MNKLRELAEAASGWPDWHNADFFAAFVDEDDDRVFNVADAAYIAYLNPTVVLLLADVVDAAEARLARIPVETGQAGRCQPGSGHAMWCWETLRAALAKLQEVMP